MTPAIGDASSLNDPSARERLGRRRQERAVAKIFCSSPRNSRAA